MTIELTEEEKLLREKNFAETMRKVDELIKKRREQPKDWWHTLWYKIKGMYL